jgi:hypothetical protein
MGVPCHPILDGKGCGVKLGAKLCHLPSGQDRVRANRAALFFAYLVDQLVGSDAKCHVNQLDLSVSEACGQRGGHGWSVVVVQIGMVAGMGSGKPLDQPSSLAGVMRHDGLVSLMVVMPATTAAACRSLICAVTASGYTTVSRPSW